METLDGIVIDFGLNKEKFWAEIQGETWCWKNTVLNCAELKEEKSGFSHGWLVVRKSNFPGQNTADQNVYYVTRLCYLIHLYRLSLTSL